MSGLNGSAENDTVGTRAMNTPAQRDVRDGDHCAVVRGTHAGKSGTVKDIKTSKTGHVTITVVRKDGERFKTLAGNVVKAGHEP